MQIFALHEQLSVSTIPGLQCELVSDFAHLEELAEHWERLAQGSALEIFQRFAWTRAFWKAFGARLSLCSLVVYEHAEVVGILPLAISEDTIRFLAEADYNDLICEERRAPAVLAAAVRALFEMPMRWNTCVLNNLSAESRIVRHWPTLPLGLRHKAALHFVCPCPTIVAEQDRDIFARLARKDSLRRHENKLRRRGRLTFRHLESRQEMKQHLPRFFEQQIARRALLGQRSHFLDPDQRAFYTALVDELDPGSELRFAALELEGRPIAYHFGFQLHRKLIWYQSGFDVDLWHCSPGEVLIRNLLQYAYEMGLREFDFTTGGEMYKSRFANLTRNSSMLYLERKPYSVAGAYRRLAALAKSAARRIKEELKARPRLYNMLKKKWLSAADFRAQQLALYRRAGLLSYARLALGRIFHNAIFAWDEALVFSFTAGALSPLDRPTDCARGMEISLCGLSELAVLSLEHPDELPRSKRDLWLARLLNGERIYGLHGDGELAHLAWTAMRGSVFVRELGDASRVPLSGRAMVIERCWSARVVRAPHSWANALRQLAQEIGDRREVWTYCINPDRELRQEIEAAGFRLRNRVVQVRALHAAHWNRIASAS
jgi:CelD/BcsL family acetyltransferase involved in cellulose biosynthesis